MSKKQRQPGDRAWLVEWAPVDAVTRDPETGDVDMDQVYSIEKRRAFETEEEAIGFVEALLTNNRDFFGCPEYGEFMWITEDEFGTLPEGPRWELIGDMNSPAFG